MSEHAVPPSGILARELPALVAARGFATWRMPGSDSEAVGAEEAARLARAQPPLLCHAPATARRLGVEHVDGYDVLELFAFARPAEFTLPTIRGLSRTLGISTEADDATDDGALLTIIADRLLNDIADDRDTYEDMVSIARTLQRAGWLWAPLVLTALDAAPWPDDGTNLPTGALAVWRDVPEWGETAPEPPPGNEPVTADEAQERLAMLLGAESESRSGQRDYAAATAMAFEPRPAPDSPNIVLAEAGTGTGKTLGYIAPASVWSEKNAGPVWISTYTRNLQQQIDQELARLYPDPDEKARQVVIRKGRENYLCLLNLEDAAGRFTTFQRRNALGVALTARWVQATRDGDLGGDFPAWLVDLVGVAPTLGLSDRRGECIYSACSHYNRCFVEHSVRKARRARLVVANHALVMIQAAIGAGDDANVPSRYVFDEGHHIFDAADSAFAAHLSGREMAELRRWLLGNEGGGRRRPGSRARGLRERAEDLIASDDSEAVEALAAAIDAAQILPAPGWLNRLSGAITEGPAEAFLATVREQVYARSESGDGPYSLETEVRPPIDGLPDAAAALHEGLVALATPLRKLCARLIRRLDEDADELESATRVRIEAVSRALQRRGEMLIGAWIDMLDAIDTPASDLFVDWVEVERIEGRELDAGLYRHWVDPTQPFAEAMAPIAHGMVFTSATLADRSGDADVDWDSADARTGAAHLPLPAVHSRVASPFDYAAQTRVFVVTDVRRNDADQVAAAMRELFLAAGGGGLGLFTSIARLRQVHARMADALDAAKLPLYAQHVDSLNVATLIDIFRAEGDACLLGTDAVRDGVDVPGRSLRLLSFDRIPWPRPTILHRARRDAFGGRNYDDMLARLRLAQAYGRLIRRKDDRGVFTILDAATPTRLFGAFPEGVVPERVGLVEAIEATEDFLGS
ncbi:MAG: helicase [Alphaproteobacteria bacterium]|nr:helicase [Alphaproteobacteria bacterium]